MEIKIEKITYPSGDAWYHVMVDDYSQGCKRNYEDALILYNNVKANLLRWKKVDLKETVLKEII